MNPIETTIGTIGGSLADRPREVIDITDLPPREPLARTLECLADLDERGYSHATVEWGFV